MATLDKFDQSVIYMNTETYTRQTEQIDMEYITEISVDERATIVAVPDTISLLIRLSAKSPGYSATVEKLNAGARDVRAALTICVVAALPQTRGYAVEEDWVNKYDDEKRRLVGYEGVQQLSISRSKWKSLARCYRAWGALTFALPWIPTLR